MELITQLIYDAYFTYFSIVYLLDQRVHFMQVCDLQSNAFKLNIHFLKPYRIYCTVEPSLYGHLFFKKILAAKKNGTFNRH